MHICSDDNENHECKELQVKSLETRLELCTKHKLCSIRF